MSVIEIIGGIIIMLCAVVIVVAVLFQEGKGGGMNALSGANESSYLGKNKSRTLQVTKYAGIAFVVVTLAVYFISSKM